MSSARVVWVPYDCAAALTWGPYAKLPVRNEIDKLVYARLQKVGYLPSDTCSDAEFLRQDASEEGARAIAKRALGNQCEDGLLLVALDQCQC